MTQQQLAHEAGTTQSYLAKIERGEVTPNYRLAQEIFRVLDEEEHRGDETAGDVMHEKITTFDASDTVSQAAKAAKDLGVDQFPILLRGRAVGSVTVTQMLGKDGSTPLGKIMGPELPSVPRSMPLSTLRDMLRECSAVLVCEKGEIVGIVSAQDLL